MSMDMTGDQSSEREEDSGIESSAPEPSDNTVFLRISVPEFKVQKCLQFQLDDNVWATKQRVLTALGKELKDGMNYGLYCPPTNGRAGKFLDEERPLRDYPMPGPIGFLELKYKRRVYKQMQVNPRKLKQLHTKSNLKQFMDLVRSSSSEKITKLTNKGLDPNYYDYESGETPLTLAATTQNPRKLLLTLVSGGAHLDFRAKDGTTALHRAAQHGNYDAIKALLDLGSSSNYKDSHGLTPLYHAVCKDTNPHCVEILLHDHSIVGIVDEQSWTEAHQACRYGRVQHLEHLVFYGADMNAQNSSGNTPLHVSAVNNQESCVRVLLFRGADKSILNYSNQDALQVAAISGNNDLGKIIQNFSSDEVVQFQEVPKYNEKRRTQMPQFYTLQRSRSDPRLNLQYPGGSTSLSGLELNSKPPSPAMSNASLPHLLSNGSSGLFDPANAGMLYRRHYDSDSPRSMSISSAGSLSGSYNSDTLPTQLFRARSLDMLDNIRRGSCFELPSSSGSSSYSYGRRRLYPAMPGRVFICIKSHQPQNEAELALRKGQFVEVLSVGEQGYWEGKVNQREGWFPSFCVEEVRMRKKARSKTCTEEDSVIVRRTTLAALSQTDGENAPRTVVLQKAKNGFGFVLRGAKSQREQTSSLEFAPTPEFPALQYLDRVDKGSAAEKVGLKAKDFLLEINGENIVNATHEHTVKLIKHSGDTLAMKVMTVKPLGHDVLDTVHMDGTRTLPMKKKAPPLPPQRNPYTSLTTSMSYQAITALDSLAELEKLDHALAQYESDPDRHSLSNSMDSQQLNAMAVSRGVDPTNKTASIRSRHSNRLTSVTLDELFTVAPQPDHSASNQSRPVVSGITPVIYANPDELQANQNRIMGSSKMEVKETRHVTTVELKNEDKVDGVHERIYAVPYATPMHRMHGSEENLTDGRSSELSVQLRPRQRPSGPALASSDVIPPPPSHPPPTPPATAHVGEVVEISTIMPHTYANVSEEIQRHLATKAESDASLESSFRPGTNARFSKVPAVLPPGVAAMQHSRTSSMGSSVSSLSDHSGGSHSSHASAKRGSFDCASSTSSSDRASVAVSNAVRGEVHYASRYYEPEPDYDKEEKEEIRQVKSRPVMATQISLETKVPPPNGDVKTRESDFNKAIRIAALSREGRRNSSDQRSVHSNSSDQRSVHSNSSDQRSVDSMKMESRSSQPPTAPPPPPAPVNNKPLQPVTQRQSPPRAAKADPNAALFAAIAQRRELVEKKDMNEVAGGIDERVNRSKKIQSTLFVGDKIKKVGSSPPVAAKHTVEKEQKVETSVVTTTYSSSKASNVKMSSVNEPPPPPSQPPPPPSQPPPPPSQPPPPLPQDEETKQLDLLAIAEQKRKEYLKKKAATSPAGTLERPYKESSEPEEPKEKKAPPPPPPMPQPSVHPKPAAVPVVHDDPKPDNANGNQGLGNLASVIASRALQRQKSGGTSTAVLSSQPKGSSVVYRSKEAATNQASLDAVEVKKRSPPKAPVPLPSSSNVADKRKSQDWSENTVEIRGATLDSSFTDSPKQNPETATVAAKAKLFESTVGGKPKARAPSPARTRTTAISSNTFVPPPPVLTDSNGHNFKAEDIPPPMIPPPVSFGYGSPMGKDRTLGVGDKNHSPIVNGRTVGESRAPISTHSPGKLSQLPRPHINNQSGVHSSGVAQILLIPEDAVRVEDPLVNYVVPPPPVFDSEFVSPPPFSEDSASTVSSVSTLSTLSSVGQDTNLQDTVQHSTPIFTSSRPIPPPPQHEKSPEIEIAPPPPGFDDSPSGGYVQISPEHQYEDFGFIPPPMEFEAASAVSPPPSAAQVSSLKSAPKPHSNSSNYPAVLAQNSAVLPTFHSKPIESWSISDVCDWLTSQQLLEHCSRFREHKISGQQLIQLGRSELIALGVTQVGQRMNIERAIKKAMMRK